MVLGVSLIFAIITVLIAKRHLAKVERDTRYHHFSNVKKEKLKRMRRKRRVKVKEEMEVLVSS